MSTALRKNTNTKLQ